MEKELNKLGCMLFIILPNTQRPELLVEEWRARSHNNPTET